MRKETVWYIVPLDEIIITHMEYGQLYATPSSYKTDFGLRGGMCKLPNYLGLMRFKVIKSGWVNSIEIGHLVRLGFL